MTDWNRFYIFLPEETVYLHCVQSANHLLCNSGLTVWLSSVFAPPHRGTWTLSLNPTLTLTVCMEAFKTYGAKTDVRQISLTFDIRSSMDNENRNADKLRQICIAYVHMLQLFHVTPLATPFQLTTPRGTPATWPIQWENRCHLKQNFSDATTSKQASKLFSRVLQNTARHCTTLPTHALQSVCIWSANDQWDFLMCSIITDIHGKFPTQPN